ncbi:hypothetical protein V8F33_002117 [Rhypophila sp. PSN 637]
MNMHNEKGNTQKVKATPVSLQTYDDTFRPEARTLNFLHCSTSQSHHPDRQGTPVITTSPNHDGKPLPASLHAMKVIQGLRPQSDPLAIPSPSPFWIKTKTSNPPALYLSSTSKYLQVLTADSIPLWLPYDDPFWLIYQYILAYWLTIRHTPLINTLLTPETGANVTNRAWPYTIPTVGNLCRWLTCGWQPYHDIREFEPEKEGLEGWWRTTDQASWTEQAWDLDKPP